MLHVDSRIIEMNISLNKRTLPVNLYAIQQKHDILTKEFKNLVTLSPTIRLKKNTFQRPCLEKEK